MLNIILDICAETDAKKKSKWIAASTKYWNEAGYKLVSDSAGPDTSFVHKGSFRTIDGDVHYDPGEKVESGNGTVILLFEAKY